MNVRKAVLSALTVTTIIGLGGVASTLVGAQNTDSGPFQFQPLPESVPCTPGGNPDQPFLLPPGYTQTIFASEPQFPDLPDMNTLNETGPQAGRFLYRAHEVSAGASVSVTNLQTLETRILAQRSHWERLDGIVWTPWGTILVAEEAKVVALPDPKVPQAKAGLVYEINPATGQAVARPAIGSRSHEGLRFDSAGNLYGISESSVAASPPDQPNPGGFLYRFTPDTPGDLSKGQLYALKITQSNGDRTGQAVWVPLDRQQVRVDSDAVAAAAGATGYNRPEDVETGTSTGTNVNGGDDVLYVAVTDEARVLRIDLREPNGGPQNLTAFVSTYVKAGVNAPLDFEKPDNLALDRAGNLFIAEDPGGSHEEGKVKGDDIWVARPGDNPNKAKKTVRFASLTDCDAEPTGIYFSLTGKVLFVNVQHRGGDGRDLAVAIRRSDFQRVSPISP